MHLTLPLSLLLSFYPITILADGEPGVPIGGSYDFNGHWHTNFPLCQTSAKSPQYSDVKMVLAMLRSTDGPTPRVCANTVGNNQCVNLATFNTATIALCSEDQAVESCGTIADLLDDAMKTCKNGQGLAAGQVRMNENITVWAKLGHMMPMGFDD